MAVTRLLLVFLLVGSCASQDSPSVTTNSGKIRGHYLTSYRGNKYKAYEGIPYAEPPVGPKRFQPPEPIQPWSTELNATKLKEPCTQQKQFSSQIIGSEDCLHLNVYVPMNEKQNESLPVILYIHGGAFRQGGVKEAAEHYIIDHNLIYVSIQYRLTVLGFLSTEDDVVPGNMGLKDQSTALRWVHDNIEHFDGDPKKITLIGFSAGGASVHYHYLSPWSRGLFHAGISASGNVFAPWTMPERSREKVLELSDSLNCTDEDIHRVIECLRKQPVNVLVMNGAALPSLRYQSFTPFGPVVEKSSSNPFIDDLPSRIINRGETYDVPWITGVVSEESLLDISSYVNDAELARVDADWMQIAPVLLDFYFTIPMEQHDNVSQTVREHYLQEKPIDKANLRKLADMVSDRLYKANAGDAALRQATASKSPVFFYHYRYRATDSLSHTFLNSTENLGVAHGDDIGLVLKNSYIAPTKSTEDMAMQRCLIRIYTSIARYGIPKLDVEWVRVSPNSTTLDFLQINGPNDLKMQSSDNFAQKKFWHSIPFQEDTV